MADPIPQKDENIVIRTMKDDLENLSGSPKQTIKKPEPVPVLPVFPISQEAQFRHSAEERDQAPIFQTPAPLPPTPMVPPLPEIKPVPVSPITPAEKQMSKPPVLVIPPKTIPPKKIPEIPAKPLFKATPIWLKIGGIGLGALLLVLIALYGYWKIFIQNQPITPKPPIATTTPPILPKTPVATTTIPIKFFNKLPNKEVTIEISSKTSADLLNALKSEAAIEETRGVTKQVKITYQGEPITTEEFLNLMFIFTPHNFLQNYENEFALAFFSHKEGARPILILKSKKRSEMETQMKDWESKTLASDIFPLFLSNGKLTKALSSFKSYLFLGQQVRFLNINLSFTSLNYAIYNDFLIFTTSSAGMFVILQDLTGQSVSLEYLKSLEASINKFIK